MTLLAAATVLDGVLPPQVEVHLTGTDLSGSTTTLFRVLPDGTRQVVRSMKGYPTTGPIYVTDWEVPFYTDIRYVAQAVKAGVTVVGSYSNTIRLCFNVAWLSDPLSPGTGIRVWVHDGGWQEQERTVPQDVFEPLGRKFPVAVSGVRKAPRYTIELTHPTDEGTVEVRRLLEQANPALLRMADPRYGGWVGGYIATGSWSEERWADQFATRTRVFSVPVVEVAGPAAATVINLWTWADVPANFSRWGDIPPVKATWADLLRNPTWGAA